MKRPLLALLALAALGAGPPLRAQDEAAARTVVVVNARQPESVALGEFYLQARSIPPENLVALPLPEAESITRREFIDQVWQPLQDELLRRGWIEGLLSTQLDETGRRRAALTGHRLAHLVLCRGVPLRVHEDPLLAEPVAAARVPATLRRNQAAVDSELALLAQGPLPLVGFVANPLFNAATAADVSAGLVVKVARLDGPTAADARGLVTSALEAERRGLIGRYYVDVGGPHASGDRWLEDTRARLVDLGYFGDVERSPAVLGIADRFDAPAFYFGWYAGAVTGPFLREGFRFPAGAIALHIHSYSAATLRSATEQWCGPLLARGAAATFGNVFEPYLEFTLRPDLLLARLAAGDSLGDAACFATPVHGWQGVVVGDPLYRPFKVGLDAQAARAAELPAPLAGYVHARQAAVLDRLGLGDEARVLLNRAQREQPSLPLALTAARFELNRGDAAAAVRHLGLFAQLREVAPADWPLVRAAGELIAAHGSAREALPVYQLLGRVPPPSREALVSVLTDTRRLADATGDLGLSLALARRIAELTPLPPVPVAGGEK